jgi:hypothetical protein
MLPLGECPRRIAPAAAMVDDFKLNKKTLKKHNKTQLLPSFLMVDQRKKAKQFWGPKQTLYSHYQCNKLRTNVKHLYLS